MTARFTLTVEDFIEALRLRRVRTPVSRMGCLLWVLVFVAIFIALVVVSPARPSPGEARPQTLLASFITSLLIYMLFGTFLWFFINQSGSAVRRAFGWVVPTWTVFAIGLALLAAYADVQVPDPPQPVESDLSPLQRTFLPLLPTRCSRSDSSSW